MLGENEHIIINEVPPWAKLCGYQVAYLLRLELYVLVAEVGIVARGGAHGVGRAGGGVGGSARL